MKAFLCLPFAALLAAGHVYAVVIRADVSDERYLANEGALPALVDLPGEGHGVLIDRKWVVTVAHATQGYTLDHVMIGGRSRTVAELIVHPEFHKPESAMIGDAAPLMTAFGAMKDIALIRLSEPVDDVTPIALYRQSDEAGQVVTIYGKGATGNGVTGQVRGSPHRGALRRAENRITSAHDQWIDYRLDCDASALPLEGSIGDGDSGGPVLIRKGDRWVLAGLGDWKHWRGDLSAFHAGVCGQDFSNTRISWYANWIDRVMAEHSGKKGDDAN